MFKLQNSVQTATAAITNLFHPSAPTRDKSSGQDTEASLNAVHLWNPGVEKRMPSIKEEF